MRWLNLKRRRARQNQSAFQGLIGTPATGDLEMPANATLYARATDAIAQGVTILTVGNRTIESTGLSAGDYVFLGYFERGRTLQTPSSIDLYLQGFDDSRTLIKSV